MKLHFHGSETFECNPEFIFKKIPDGKYFVRTTVEPTETEQFVPYDFQWPVELRDGTITALPCDIPSPDA